MKKNAVFMPMIFMGALVLTAGCGPTKTASDESNAGAITTAGALILGQMPLQPNGDVVPGLKNRVLKDEYLNQAETRLLTQQSGFPEGFDYPYAIPSGTPGANPSALASSFDVSALTGVLGQANSGGSGKPATATAPSFGSGGVGKQSFGNGSLVVTPQFSGGVSSGSSASGGGDLVEAVCSLFEGMFSYIGRCYGGAPIDINTYFGTGGNCRLAMSKTLGEAHVALATVDARAVRALDCVGDKMKSAACGAGTDISSPILGSLRGCGLAIGSTTAPTTEVPDYEDLGGIGDL